MLTQVIIVYNHYYYFFFITGEPTIDYTLQTTQDVTTDLHQLGVPIPLISTVVHLTLHDINLYATDFIQCRSQFHALW